MWIKELKDRHCGEDIWIIASGSSLNYIDPSFFENKVTVAVNRACCFFECDYVVTKDKRGFEHIRNGTLNKDIKIVISRSDCGNPSACYHNIDQIDHSLVYFYDHGRNFRPPQIEVIDKNSDSLITSWSTITTSIHFAAYLGAKNIIICGHDCGKIDGNVSISGYSDIIEHVQGSEKEYYKWLIDLESDTDLVCSKVKDQYGCNIHSLNPFIHPSKLQRRFSK